MTITFEPLHESYFPLLLKWLEAPHVKKWWDQDVTYTLELVKEKFGPRVWSLRTEDKAIQEKTGSPRHFVARDDEKATPHNGVIQGFIICSNQSLVGYIQIYNAYDFPRSKTLSGLPANLGAFDIFIGEAAALQQGLGSKAILEFLRVHGNQYSHIFADPDSNNIAAVKAYEKAGFKKVSEQEDTGEVWMIKDMNITNFPRIGLGVLIFNSSNQILLGKRKNAHGASSWGPPGGHLEFGESLEACVIRETLEETGLIIKNPKFLAITNDIFKAENKHYVSIFMKAHIGNTQIVQNLEPHKVEYWGWFHLKNLPEHLFLPLKQLSSGFAYGQTLDMQNLKILVDDIKSKKCV